MNRVNNLSSLFVFINCIIFLSYKSSILDYWLGTNSLHCQLRKCSIWFDLQIQCSYSYIDIYVYIVSESKQSSDTGALTSDVINVSVYSYVCVFIARRVYSKWYLSNLFFIHHCFRLWRHLFLGVVSIIKSAYLSLSLCLFSLCFAALTSVIQG